MTEQTLPGGAGLEHTPPAETGTSTPPTSCGLKPKDLIGVPWRRALALPAAGGWLRAEIIGYKPNAYPESVRDRPAKTPETVFLLSKPQDYCYAIDAVRGPAACAACGRLRPHPSRGGMAPPMTIRP